MAALTAASTAAVTAVSALAKSEMNLIDSQAKLARSMGATVTGIRAINLAADNSGLDGMEQSLARMNRRLGAVEISGGPAAVTVERLNLDLKALAELDADEKLALISDRIVETGMSSQEAARHLQNLGFQQRGATELFMSGGDAIRAARADIELFGLAVSEVDAAKIEEAN